LARVGGAGVRRFLLTGRACVAFPAGTGEPGHAVRALAAVLTGIGLTVVDIRFAYFTFEALGAVTNIGLMTVDAGSCVLAGVGGTIIDALTARIALPAADAETEKRCDFIGTNTAVLTGVG